MKILLDECVTKKLKAFLPAHDVYTVTEKGWNGLYNGELMTKCVEDKIDILLTIDKNILFQQSIIKYDLTVVVLNVADSKIETLIQFLGISEDKVDSFERRKLYVIDLQSDVR